jgi:hypothetical protein
MLCVAVLADELVLGEPDRKIPLDWESIESV